MTAPDLQGLAHFSIPVSDIEASESFYCDVVGCRSLFTNPPKKLELRVFAEGQDMGKVKLKIKK